MNLLTYSCFHTIQLGFQVKLCNFHFSHYFLNYLISFNIFLWCFWPKFLAYPLKPKQSSLQAVNLHFLNISTCEGLTEVSATFSVVLHYSSDIALSLGALRKLNLVSIRLLLRCRTGFFASSWLICYPRASSLAPLMDSLVLLEDFSAIQLKKIRCYCNILRFTCRARHNRLPFLGPTKPFEPR